MDAGRNFDNLDNPKISRVPIGFGNRKPFAGDELSASKDGCIGCFSSSEDEGPAAVIELQFTMPLFRGPKAVENVAMPTSLARVKIEPVIARERQSQFIAAGRASVWKFSAMCKFQRNFVQHVRFLRGGCPLRQPLLVKLRVGARREARARSIQFRRDQSAIAEGAAISASVRACRRPAITRCRAGETRMIHKTRIGALAKPTRATIAASWISTEALRIAVMCRSLREHV